MENGHFYFVKDSFYDSLPDCKLMANKDYDTEKKGGRPCHYCFKDDDYYWMVPISSKVEKYHRIYESKIEKKGYCDGIRFGFVNGNERAFLIQNCFPISDKYIDQEYKVNKNTVSIVADTKLSAELNALIRKVIRLYKKDIFITLTDIKRIIAFLEKEKT